MAAFQTDDFDLTGRRALVTGASRGIGRAVAVALARRGADVLAVARSTAGLDETAAAAAGASGSIHVRAVDLRHPDHIRATVDHAVDVLGGLDVLVNNAASGHWSLIEDTDLATYQQVLELNLQSCWLLCQAASGVLGDGASVINVASMLGTVGSRNETAYVAAKHALVGLTRALAVEWGRRGVRVNALGPGYVETAMTIEGLVEEGYSAWVRRNTPLGRWAQPEEMTGPVVFLASPASGFMTGQVLVVDGGWTAR
ncbi:SDR family NAD(P)-dependent oxidoreductase [Streptomyces boluensis]|uniref:SDR family oxidoreductase n=1 Tax=Streptomyces boluensis TaxID=1775135 RepID=A0A964UIX0_9ACTN|nr:SDR family oxidoreductase [Streptomyces boluensis]NBE49998.1 SDR family oxidoreductase [Streptomyces boluensis]